MKKEQLAVQLYTLRDHLGSPAEITETLRKIKAMGVGAVEPFGLDTTRARELKEIMDGEGFVCCSAHDIGADILGNPKAVIERMDILGCRYACYPYPGGVELNSRAAVMAFADLLNKSAYVLNVAGKQLLYHNHQIEFRKIGGQLILEYLLFHKDTKLMAELDTHWVQHGGGDPIEWCARMKDRLPILHLKDFRINKDNAIEFAEIGGGNLNFKGIIREAEASGCQWFVIEQDICPGDPFESVRQSVEYLHNNICA
jgi:sugar phosphate isomerase/epimerase